MLNMRRMGLLGLAMTSALLLAALITAAVFAQGTAPGRGGPGTVPGMMGRGMMSGSGSITPTLPIRPGMPGGRFGPHMWGGFGHGQGMGPGMMGAYSGCPVMGETYEGKLGAPGLSGKRLSGDQVEKAVEGYLDNTYRESDLKIVEIMEYERNFYAQIAEKSTEVNAFELLVDPYSGVVWPEYGPNMMWNTKYGQHAQMMGGAGGLSPIQPSTDLPVTPIKAIAAAQQYLDETRSGLEAGEPEPFYGYYTLHALNKDGEIAGMLSVNGYTGQVWYHTWHGDFEDMVTEME